MDTMDVSEFDQMETDVDLLDGADEAATDDGGQVGAGAGLEFVGWTYGI